MLRQRQNLAPKNKLRPALRSWLPILQCGLGELKETLEPLAANNPFVSVESKAPVQNQKKNFFKEASKNSVSDALEATTIYRESLYETLCSQINPPLFPTKISQQIAYKIIECINSEGYFEYDAEILGEFSEDEVERVRARFAYLEPAGVGARDLKESFLFQLESSGQQGEIYSCAREIIQNLGNLQEFAKLEFYDAAMKAIKKFKNPPAIEFLDDEPVAAADICVAFESGNISVSVNDDFYPQVVLDVEGQATGSEFIAQKTREARELVDALAMRKATLKKIGLMIVEYQYDYFSGGDIKPMKLKNIAEDLGYNPSTISRAIANKYLECPRGTIALKSFFTASLGADGDGEEVSNAAIKDFILHVIKSENTQKPLSDLKILELAQKEFSVNMVRRTITKYRKALNIGSSSERKRIYEMQGGV